MINIKNRTFRLSLLLLTIFFCFNSVYAQRSLGEISGIVKDETTNETLPYAVILLQGTSINVVSDLDGVFRFTNLEPGDYTLEVRYIGYKPQGLTVQLSSGERKSVVILMSDPYTSLGEVVVTAQRMGQNAAINQRLNSDALVNVVSKDAIRELPDINAAEAIGRLPGISLTRSGGEGAKVILRGLDPKFASVNINGISQPATDLNDRSVDLSNISPEMLSGIEIFKSPTADMDGDAIAGSVNLVIAKAPDLPKNQFRIYGGFNGLRESFSDYKASWDFTRRFFNKKLGVMAQANYDQKDRSAHGFNLGYHVPDQMEPEKFYIDGVTLTNREQMTKRYGVSAFLDYQFKNAGLYFNNIYNASPRVIYSQTEALNRTSYLVNHGISLSEANTQTINSSLGGVYKLPFMKIDWNLTRVQTGSYTPYNFSMSFTTDGPGLDNTKDFGTVTDPKFFFDNLLFKGTVKDEISTFRTQNFNTDTLKQTNYIAKVDLEVPLKLGDKISGFFKFGGKYQTEDGNRSGALFSGWTTDIYPNQRLIMLANEPSLMVNASNFVLMSNFNQSNGVDLMNGSYHMYSYIPESRIRSWKNTHFILGEQQTGNAEFGADISPMDTKYYLATERTTSAYVMFKINYGDFLSLVPGLRYEHSNNDYTGVFSTLGNAGRSGFFRIQESNQNYEEFLPSIHLKIKPVSWMDFRLSTVKTLSRPNYNWLLPRIYFNSGSYTVNRGNPDLKHATAWNYDASVTIYTGEFGFLSFGGYYKNISNMFYPAKGNLSAEQSFALGMGRQPLELTENYINLDDSYVKGLEFEYNTHFNFLPSPFNRFLLGFNVTRLWSSTFYPYWNKVLGIVMDRNRPTIAVDFTRSEYIKLEDRMPSQVDWTSNAWLGFELKGFSTRLSLAYQGTRLTSIDTEHRSKAFNNYTASTTRIDFTAKQKINNMFSVLLNMNNLTNAIDQGYRYMTQFPTYQNMYGFTGELGLQINF